MLLRRIAAWGILVCWLLFSVFIRVLPVGVRVQIANASPQRLETVVVFYRDGTLCLPSLAPGQTSAGRIRLTKSDLWVHVTDSEGRFRKHKVDVYVGPFTGGKVIVTVGGNSVNVENRLVPGSCLRLTLLGPALLLNSALSTLWGS